MVGDGERREGRARELLDEANRGEGLESRGEGFLPGDQVGFDNRGEGEPLPGDASASCTKNIEIYQRYQEGDSSAVTHLIRLGPCHLHNRQGGRNPHTGFLLQEIDERPGYALVNWSLGCAHLPGE